MNAQNRMIAVIIVGGLALLAALWVTTISPKREESSQVSSNVAAQQLRLDTAQAQLATFRASRKQFPGLLAELRRLDKAVPTQAAISKLLRQVQSRANVRSSDLRIAALKSSGVGAATTTTTNATPGSTPGPAGLSAMPFSFEYNGKYFRLRDVLAAARKAVAVQAGDLKIDGRLLTIDGVTFRRPDTAQPLTRAVVNATAYFAPEGASPQVPASAGAATQGGS